MEYDVFGNPIIDRRSDVRKKIDELWNTYCELFDTCISLDAFALTEEKMLDLMSRSVEDKVDYLSPFILEDCEDSLSFATSGVINEDSNLSGDFISEAGFSKELPFKAEPFSEKP